MDNNIPIHNFYKEPGNIQKLVTPINIMEYDFACDIDLSRNVVSEKSSVHLITIDMYKNKPGIDVINFLSFRKGKKCACLCDIDIFRERVMRHTKNGELFDLMHNSVLNRTPILFVSNVTIPYNNEDELITDFIVCDTSIITQEHLKQMLKIAIFQGFKDVAILLHYEDEYVMELIQHMDRSLLSHFNSTTFECNKSNFLEQMFPDLVHPPQKRSKCVVM